MSVSQRSGKKGWATCTNKNSAVAEMGDRLATIVMGRKVRAVGPLSGGGAGLNPLNVTQCGLGRGLPPYQVAS